MKVIGTFCSIRYAALSVLVLASVHSKNTACTTPSLPGRSGGWNGSDFVTFKNEPSEVTDGYKLSVHYLCTQPCVVGVDVVAPSEWRTGPLVFQKRWISQHNLGKAQSRSLSLRFPAAMAYQKDFFIRHSVDAQDVMLRAWLDHLERYNGSSGGLDAYHRSPVRVFTFLETLPPSERPVKEHKMCLSWGPELIWRRAIHKAGQCPHESGIVDLLTFPLASTGENFGVIRQFQPFINKELEEWRSQTMEEPRLTLSVWIYLLSWCDRQHCGILQHMNFDSQFVTPMLLLTNTGDILFQVRMASGSDRGFQAHTALPLRVWHRLDIFMQGPKVTMLVRSIMPPRVTTEMKHTYNFQDDVSYNDTSGYFVIGGGKFMPSIQGYFGPMKYYRLGAHHVVNPLHPHSTMESLGQTYRACDNMKQVIVQFSQALREAEEEQHTCNFFYVSLMKRFGGHTSKALLMRLEGHHSNLQGLLQIIEQDFISGSWSKNVSLRFGRRVYELVERRLAAVHFHPSKVSSLMPLLKLSSCSGNAQATLLMAAIYLAGLGVPVDIVQGHVYSLIGAQADSRLALMHIAYKHTQGIDGFPKDYDMAYSYYGNVGKQACLDRWKVQMTKQYTAEPILLTDEKTLKSQTDEKDDIFQYIKFQAERGDMESQKKLARMMFWGQQGVSKNLEGALHWYSQSAMRMIDAQAMYDYSILLLKGQGVKKNTTLGLQLMEKAAALGLPQAINGMGWYYSTFMADYETAGKYFEQAAQNGSGDAVYNLGLFYLSGSYPGKPGRNQTAAFQHFLIASLYGHFDATVEAAWYYATGALPVVGRDPERAVRMLKQMCEQNGYLGSILRQGLDAYLRGSRMKALLNYLLAAETGLAVAQINTAHICEELGQRYGCELRYYNHSTYNYSPHPSGLLKMGDYYYEGRSNQTPNVSLSILMYGKAAVAGSSQGIFNLAVMIEAENDIPDKILEQLQITKKDQLDRSHVLEKLYQCCRQYEDQMDLSPCSLALFRIQLWRAWKKFIQSPAQSILVYVIGSSVIAAVLSTLIQSLVYRGVLFRRAVDQSSSGASGQAEGQQEDVPLGHHGRHSGAAQRQVEQGVQRVTDWAWSLLGACLCAVGTALLAQIL